MCLWPRPDDHAGRPGALTTYEDLARFSRELLLLLEHKIGEVELCSEA
jgi:hypothetical protein